MPRIRVDTAEPWSASNGHVRKGIPADTGPRHSECSKIPRVLRSLNRPTRIFVMVCLLLCASPVYAPDDIWHIAAPVGGSMLALAVVWWREEIN